MRGADRASRSVVNQSLTIRRVRLANTVFLLLAVAGLVYAMYPGRFDGDAISQYNQGLAFYFDDTHSVLNSALFGLLSHLGKGPGPMFVLQLCLLGGGLLMLTDTVIGAGHPVAGLAMSVLALAPLLSFDFFDVQKDALESALLIVLVGFGTRVLLRRPVAGAIGIAAAIGIFILALDTRQNAIFAVVPLWLLFQPIRRLSLAPVLRSAVIALVAFASAEVALDRIDHTWLRAERSHIQSALFVFDLAGISARTGRDASEGLLPGLQASLPHCYSPRQWDAYYLDVQCTPINTAARLLALDDQGRSMLTRVWIGQIAHHPAAYLRHRARNFGCLIRLGCYDSEVMSLGWAPRPWDEPDMRVTPAARIWAAAADLMWRGPLGYGVLWIALLLAEFGAAAWRLRRRGFEPLPYAALALAAAGLSYALSFAVAGVSDQMRYLHPVMLLAVMTAPLILASRAAAA